MAEITAKLVQELRDRLLFEEYGGRIAPDDLDSTVIVGDPEDPAENATTPAPADKCRCGGASGAAVRR